MVSISMIVNLSNGLTSGSEITPCNKINEPLVFYRLTGNVMTSILHNNIAYIMTKDYNNFTAEMRFQSNLNGIR